MMLLYSRYYLVLTLLSMIGLALPSDHEASVMTTRKLAKGSKKNPLLLFQEQIPIKMEAPKMMSELEVTATVAEIVNDILNDDQRRSLVINIVPRKMYSVETTDMTETECTNPEAECEKNSDSTGYRWCGSTQTCVPPGGPFPLSCFTDAPTPEEACEKNSDSTGYRWCGSTQTCVPPGDPFPFSCSLTPEEACDKNSGSTGYRWCGSTQTCVPPGGLLPLSCFTDAPLTPEEACDMNSGSTGYRWCAGTQTCVPPGGDFPPSCFTGIACYKASIAIESKVALRPNAIAKLKNVLVKGIARNGVSVRGTKQAYVPKYVACPHCESCTCDDSNTWFDESEKCVEANPNICTILLIGGFGKVCEDPSKLVQCPPTEPCSTTARTFTGPNSLCTGLYDGNKGTFTCNEIVAHETNYEMYFNCMDDPSSSDGRCVAQSVCYP